MADRLCALLERRGRPLEVGHVVSQLLRLRNCPERLGRAIVGEIVEADARLTWHGRDLVGFAPLAISAGLAEAGFCVVDLETTGGSPGRAKITEIAAVRVRGLVPGESFSMLVNPGRPIPPAITAITAITDEMVAGQPDISEALPLFLEFCGDDVLVAHNAPFDLRFLNYERRRLLGSYFTQPWVDTLALARRLLNGQVARHDLATLASWAGTVTRPCHRALADAQAAAELLVTFLRMMDEQGEDTLARVVALGQWRGARHSHKLALTEGLPQAPGVYLMRDRRGEVLYVGKAVNLRRRVRSYFGPGGRHGRKVGRALEGLERVEHEVCGSEFEALWREARLIREHRPPCNGRGLGGGQYLKLSLGEDYPRLFAVSAPTDATALHAGPVRSARLLKLAIGALHRLYPLRSCRWVCGEGAHPPAGASEWCLGPCRGEGRGYAEVVAEVRRLLEADLVTATAILAPRLEEAAGAGRLGPEDAEAVEALVSVFAALGRVRRALSGVGVLLEAAPAPDRVTAFFVAGGQVVHRDDLPAVAWKPAARAGLERLRAAAAGVSGVVPPGALPEVMIVSERMAMRRATPAFVLVDPGGDPGAALDALGAGIAWVLRKEAPAVPLGEMENASSAA
jgi:DNA polymerase-3 subunit epsilon